MKGNHRNKEEQLDKIFKQVGVYLLEDEYDDALELDSLQFISLVVYIEEEFEIVVDDQMITNNALNTFNSTLKTIILLTGDENEKSSSLQ